MDAHTADLIIDTVENNSGLMKDSSGSITHYVITAENWRRVRTSITNSVETPTEAPKDGLISCPCGDRHSRDEHHQLGMVCGRCNKHTGNNNQGHYWSLCKVLYKQGVGSIQDAMREPHFCCPGDCELEEATRD